MVATERLGYLSSWELDPRVANELEGTGFPTLVKIAKSLKSTKQHDNNLLDALIKLYDPDTNSFKVGDKYLLFSLEDVLYISGLKVEGKLLVKDKKLLKKIKKELKGCGSKICIPGLGKVDRSFLLNSDRISLKELEKFMSVPMEVNDIGPYVRAFCLYVLGTVILSSQDHKSVPAFYLIALMDINKIKDYAWGATMLANLHYRLSTHAGLGKGVGGCLFFLMVWLYEHVPSLIQVFGVEEPEEPRPRTFPLAVEWADMVSQRLGRGRRNKQYESLLDELWDAENKKLKGVTPRPYARLGNDFLPDVVREQKRMGMYYGILVHPSHSKKTVYHHPEVWPEKLGFDIIDTSDCPPKLPEARYYSLIKHIKQWELKCFVKGHNETHAETSPSCRLVQQEFPLLSNTGDARDEASSPFRTAENLVNDTFVDCSMEHNDAHAETSPSCRSGQQGEASSPFRTAENVVNDTFVDCSFEHNAASAGTSSPLRLVMTSAAPAETFPSSHPVQHESSPLRISDIASAGTSSPLRPVMTSAG